MVTPQQIRDAVQKFSKKHRLSQERMLAMAEAMETTRATPGMEPKELCYVLWKKTANKRRK